RSRMAVNKISDYFYRQAFFCQRSAYDTGIAVMEWAHLVIEMGDMARACTDSRLHFLKRSIRMADRRNHTVLCQVFDVCRSVCCFRGRRRAPDLVPAELRPFFEYRIGTFHNVFSRLCPCPLIGNARPFQVDAQHFSLASLHLETPTISQCSFNGSI